MQTAPQGKALSLEQFIALLERKTNIPGVLSFEEVGR